MADPQRDAAVAAWKANEDMRLYGGARRLKDYIVLPDDRIACGFAILAAEERGRRAGLEQGAKIADSFIGEDEGEEIDCCNEEANKLSREIAAAIRGAAHA